MVFSSLNQGYYHLILYRAKQKANKQKTSVCYKRKPVYAIKEMNEKIKVIKKENEKRKAVIRTQRWRL